MYYITLLLYYVVTVNLRFSHGFSRTCIGNNTCEPRHEKTCLRELPTRSDSNQPSQLQRQARGLQFLIYKLEVLYYLSSETKKALIRLRGCAG